MGQGKDLENPLKGYTGPKPRNGFQIALFVVGDRLILNPETYE
jgi:hypothetical protein